MKQAYFFVDDVIWCLRDVAKERPASIFDNSYFKMLKKCHDEWGMTVQLNLFYRTDFSTAVKNSLCLICPIHIKTNLLQIQIG